MRDEFPKACKKHDWIEWRYLRIVQELNIDSYALRTRVIDNTVPAKEVVAVVYTPG
jgi:hypothetical protein